MNERHVGEQLSAYLSGNLDEASSRIVREHLASCSSCRHEHDDLQRLWNELGGIPDERPDASLTTNFYAMLRRNAQDFGESRRVHERAWKRRLIVPQWFGRPAFQLGFAAVMLAIGFFFGQGFSGNGGNTEEIAQLREQVRELSNLVTVSLLHQRSASERLKGVNWSHRLAGPDADILTALVNTMKYDPNVNVRLAALDALARDIDDPAVRREIINTFPHQTSPLMQMALVDLLVQINDQEAHEALQQALKRPGLNPEVLKRIKLGVQLKL